MMEWPPPLLTTASLATTSLPTSIQTVFLIVMENKDWSDIVGNPSAPYLNNTLLPISSHAEQYFNPPGIHPSLPNYIWLEAGSNLGIYNNSHPDTNHKGTSNHLVTLLSQAGISWKVYAQGFAGGDCPNNDITNAHYVVRHNPTMYFDDVRTNTPYCIQHERSYSELATDLQSNNVASYNLIIPDLCHDMHDDCPPLQDRILQGDRFLNGLVPAILNSVAYHNGGAIFITWDEGNAADGPIGMIVLSLFAKGNGYSNAIHYTHGSTLRTLQNIFGVGPLLRDAANSTDLGDLFLPEVVVNPPKASFRVSPRVGSAPLTVTFTDTSIGTITNRNWRFGDGTKLDTTNATISHTYTSIGSNTVRLIVSGPAGTSKIKRGRYIAVTNSIGAASSISQD